MDSHDIAELTTCRNTDLAQVRRNLLMAGYGIHSSSDDDLITDFKEVSGYGGGRTMQRITVLKMDSKQVIFKVRIKVEEIQAYPTNSMSSSMAMDDDRRWITTYRFYSVYPMVHESDQSYYREYRAAYEQTRREVCGDVPSEPAS